MQAINGAKPEEQAVIDGLADSASFRKAPVLRELLVYLWQHRESVLSEYAIGTEILGRKPDFDPKTDSSVRVHISRLRTRLKEYYEANPAALRVTIPPGEYRLDFQRVAGPIAEVSLPTRREFPWRFAAVGATAAAVALGIDDVRQRYLARPSAPALDRFWLSFLRKDKPITLIVPAPLFLRWPEQPFLARDFRVNRRGEISQSSYLDELRKKYGEPEENHLYTIASDTLAASSVSRYLEDRGIPAMVLDTPSAGLEILSSQDAIVFLGPGTSEQLPDVMNRLSFGFKRMITGTNRGLYDRRKPSVEYPITMHSQAHSTGHGLIALLPGKAPGTHLLVVASSFNPALASVLSISAELELFSQFLVQQNAGKYFESIVRYDRNGDKVLDVRPVAARSLSS